MKSGEEAPCIYLGMVNLLQCHAKEWVLVEEEAILSAIREHAIHLVVHDVIFKFVSDVVGFLDLFAILIVQKLKREERLQDSQFIVNVMDIPHWLNYE